MTGAHRHEDAARAQRLVERLGPPSRAAEEEMLREGRRAAGHLGDERGELPLGVGTAVRGDDAAQLAAGAVRRGEELSQHLERHRPRHAGKRIELLLHRVQLAHRDAARPRVAHERHVYRRPAAGAGGPG
ncbi:MAG TPA: hypothetical protein VNO26_12840 [Candidatus Limnocylindria bacterium]|nr:hypothetical protein [Candidatus Limnocylindria bacterium]